MPPQAPICSLAVPEYRLEAEGIPARVYEPSGASALVLLGHNGTRDDMFRTQDVGELFSAFGSTDRRIIFWEADHGELLEEMVVVSMEFLRRQAGLNRPAP